MVMAETKICKCVCCGVDVEVTKFASAQKVKCESCKTSGAEANSEILQSAKAEQNAKKEARHVDGVVGDKKKSTCTKCGAETWIGKFASHKTALCDDCKEQQPIQSTGGSGTKRATVNMDRVDESLLPSLDELYIIPVAIANPKLRHVCCPACGTPNMNITKILDSSPQRGLVIEYQCQNDDCLVVMSLSEQALTRINPRPGVTFNYRGEQINEMMSKLGDTKYKNLMVHMYNTLKENNIDIGHNVEEYVNLYEIKKAIPTGLDMDRLKKMIEECKENE